LRLRGRGRSIALSGTANALIKCPFCCLCLLSVLYCRQYHIT
jgi:hypothetical protein